MKAQRLERQAEQCLINKRLKRIRIETELYNRIGDQAGRRLHAADVNLGAAYALRHSARIKARVVECIQLNALDDSDISASTTSGVDLETRLDASDL